MSNDHKLAAILFADIAGYTAMMQKNEQGALELLNRFKEVLEEITPKHQGRIVQYFGDGCLLSFDSSTNSVDCAIELQKAFSEIPVVPVRIGLHLGDVIFKNDNVFGDGVNIASRIESLGIPGAILMSKTIRDQIKNQKEFLLVSLGSFDFKNVEEKMEVFALANPGFVVPKREEMRGKLKNVQKNTGIKWIAGIAVLTVLVLVFWFFIGQKKSAETISDKSIAVLPFVNMSDNKEQEYFSDGLSEELINLLTKIPELKVIGRTSSFSFKGKNEDLRSIAEKLGVAHLLEGSVRKDGNKIRVTAQLIKATDGSHLWSETYDRDLKGIFKLQDEIAGAVVKQLKLKLLPVSDNSASSVTNTEVYNLILQGNYFSEKRDKENLAKALDFYLQALAIDSLNARSWAGVAKCFSLQATWNWIDRNQGYKKAELAANKAIALDEKQAEGHKVLGSIKMNGLDWDGAEVEFQKALNLEPGNADVLRVIGLLYRCLGRYDEAIQLTKQSIALDPIKGITYSNFGLLLYYANHLEEAIASYKKVLELNPQFPRAHVFFGKVYLLQGKPELALEEMSQEADETWKIFGLILTYQALGRKKEADKLLSDYIIKFQKDEAYLLAEIYAFRGEKDRAFEWLEKSYIAREPTLLFLKGDPLLKNLWPDPRYKALLKKMNLPLD